MSRLLTALVCTLAITSTVAAQGCDGNGFATLEVGVGTLGGTLTPTLTAAPGAQFTWFVDVAPGVIPFAGIGTACLGFTPAMITLADGIATGAPTIPPSGTFTTTVPLPSAPSLLGVAFYSQFGALDNAAPGGVALSNPRSVLMNLPDNFVNSLGTLSTFGTALHQSTVFGDGRYVLVSGGGSGTLLAPTPGMQTEVYDSYTHSFLPGPNLSVPRVLHTGTALDDGRILIAGGLDGVATNNWSDAEIYDPATGTMTVLGSMMQGPRAAHAATLLDDGRVLITGGNTIFAVSGAGNFIQIYQSAHDQVDIFDPTTNTFTPGPPMLEKRAGHSAVKLPDGRVLVAGGISDGNLITIPFLPPIATPVYAVAAEIYDPATNSWSATGMHSTGRILGNMEVLPSGNVLLCGGASGATLTSTDAAEIWDGSNSTWSGPAAITMPATVALAASTVLPDGTVAVLGGASGSQLTPTSLDQVARFSETNFSWTSTTPLPIPLSGHTLSALPDGSFVVVGGSDATGTAQANSYVWNQ